MDVPVQGTLRAAVPVQGTLHCETLWELTPPLISRGGKIIRALPNLVEKYCTAPYGASELARRVGPTFDNHAFI